MTPIIEDLRELNLSSHKKGSKDDFTIKNESKTVIEVNANV